MIRICVLLCDLKVALWIVMGDICYLFKDKQIKIKELFQL
jgi:hypothetical protein